MANQSVVSRLSASAGPIYLVARNNAGRLHQTSDEPAAFANDSGSVLLFERGNPLPRVDQAGTVQMSYPLLDAAILRRRGGHPTKNTAIEYQTADSEHVSKRPRPFGPSDEVNTLPVNIMPISYSSQNHGQSSYTSDDLPKNPVMALNQGSAVKSMDFLPVQKILFPFPGVAYSRHIVHVYSYHGGADIRNHLEVCARSRYPWKSVSFHF
ncbi:TOPLESS-RELATED PROTEIN 4-LIKE [Salix purpurea]|uniref:TOPLESS-RELATED PROTEIN 4-LIKE n=1 Tax=Salix purpurea TaxID=77065 RepID=A0A9Q0UKP7_SALPP|nr:TOPLESS-RELATED PROTEIN 4-LIKE [Salix purpurea]